VLQRESEKRKLQLISLMDVVFILLLFFLVSVFFASMPNEERKLPVPTPKNEPGYAQVLIQLIDDKKFFYVDPLITKDLVKKITEIDRMTYLSPAERLKRKKELLLRTCTFTYTDPKMPNVNRLRVKINQLIDLANKSPQARYFVMIRCPDNLEYASVIQIIQQLSKAKYGNIQYGLVGGTIDDIRKSRSIEKKIVQEEAGRRRNVVITF